MKLTGKAELPAPLILGKDYTFLINGTITAATEKDNADGTTDMMFRFEPLTVEEQ